MTIIELMDRFTRLFESQPRAYASSTLASYAVPGSTRRLVGFSWLSKALAGAIALGAVVMDVGRGIVELGFKVTMYGFGLWVVTSTIKYLSVPLTRLATVAAVGDAPQATA